MQLFRFQRRRTKGYKLPFNTVSVCRPGYFGNPFKIGQSVHLSDVGVTVIDDISHVITTNEQAVSAYDCWLHNSVKGAEVVKNAKAKLKGKNLACFCAIDQKCHADVLLKIANE